MYETNSFIQNAELHFHQIIPEFKDTWSYNLLPPIGYCYRGLYQNLSGSYDMKESWNKLQIQFLELFRIGDSMSYRALDFMYKNMYYLIFHMKLYNFWDDRHRSYYEQYEQEKQQIEKMYGISDPVPEVYFFHHGLRFASEKIKKYVCDRDIIDVGAYDGDSATVLHNYTQRYIYSYEIMRKSYNDLRRNLRSRNITNRHVAIRKGVSSFSGEMNISDNANPGSTLTKKGRLLTKVTTIDKEVNAFNMNPGFIKADIEGDALNMLKGAKKTLKQYRPVLSLAVYHSYEEMFEIPSFLESYNYIIRYELNNWNLFSGGEVGIFAYPMELI